MDYAEQLFRAWASKEGLTALYITSGFHETEEPLRLWWFFVGFNLISPQSGICDEEVIMFFSRSQQFTEADRMIIDSQQNSH